LDGDSTPGQASDEGRQKTEENKQKTQRQKAGTRQKTENRTTTWPGEKLTGGKWKKKKKANLKSHARKSRQLCRAQPYEKVLKTKKRQGKAKEEYDKLQKKGTSRATQGKKWNAQWKQRKQKG